MVKPKNWCNGQAVEALDETETSVSTASGTETAWEMDPDGLLQLGLDKGGAEVDRDGGPFED